MRLDTELAIAVDGVIKRRRSCRSMNGKPIAYEVIEAIVEAGIWAPSGSNQQNVRFLILKTPERMRELAQHKVPKSVIMRASAGVLVMTDDTVPTLPRERGIWSQLWAYNAGAAIQNMLLLATSMGFASCWISFFNVMDGTRLTSGKRWRELFPEHEIPSGWSVHGLVLLGHTDECDEDGFPKGDERHGGRDVLRPSLDGFVLQERQ